MNIKTTLAAAIIAIMPMTAQAEQRTAMDICTAWGQSAATIMTSRQAGVPLSTRLSSWENINPTQYQMVLDAYSIPRYSTDRMIAVVIEDFRNDEELKCFNEFGAST